MCDSLKKENYIYDYEKYKKLNDNTTTCSDRYRSSSSSTKKWIILGNSRSDV